MVLQIIFSFLASLGFGFIFNIRGKNLIYASIGGCLGWFTYLIIGKVHWSVILSYFLASIIISIYSEIMARVLKTPVTTLIVVSLIPLVPGAGMYYTVYEAIQGNLHNSILKGIQTISYALSLAVGIILISTVTRQISIIRSSRRQMATPLREKGKK